MSERPMTPCPPDSNLMKAWNTYKATEDFKNTLYWASAQTQMRPERAAEIGLDPTVNVATDEMKEQRVQGSLWAAFMAGFAAAGGIVTF